jgi:hypothetical protein
METLNIDALELWKISGATAILTALLSIAVNYVLSSRKETAARIESLRYQALRVALALEKFAIACAGIVSDAEIFVDSSGNAGSKADKLPELFLPDATEWKYFEIETANTILAFENQIADSNNSIDFAVSEATTWDPTDEAEVQAGLCGYLAVQMADELRRTYKLGSRQQPLHGWDYVAALKKMHDMKQEFYKKVRASRV